MNYWFTSDYHLGHKNIIKYCSRPFKSLEQMNNTIIKNHNERVKPEDVVFMIGDFCFKNSPNAIASGEGDIFKAIDYEKRLNGKIIFVKGNHDKNNSTKTIIESLVIRYGNKWIKLVHSPDTQYIDTRYDLIFCGHVHNNWKFKRIRQGYSFVDVINIGVDVNNFYPQSFNEIIKEYTRWRKKYDSRK